MPSRRRTLGDLTCLVIDKLLADQPPQAIVILCHGFGAPGTDLVPLAQELFALHPGLANVVQFIFPEAPLELSDFGMPDSRAWWMIDLDGLNRAIETGDSRGVRRDCEVGLPPARTRLTRLIEDVVGQAGIPMNKLVLGGFSQGAMVATDVALHLPQAPGALCILSGSLVCEEEWRELAVRRGPLRILQSHGTADPILPYRDAESLHRMLVKAGLDVDFVSFPGVHTIPFEALHRVAALVGEVAGAGAAG